MKKLLFLFFTLLPNMVFSEDIELYIGSTAARTANKPQVLLIFDNSGSMRGNVSIKTPYNPNYNNGNNYPSVGFSKVSSEYVYYVKGDATVKPIADDPDEKRKFLLSLNSCKVARDKLATLGFYTGYVREYTFVGNSGSWTELPETDGSNIKIVDCWDDVRLGENTNVSSDKDGNTVASGYPIDGVGLPTSPIYYTGSASASNTDLGTGAVVTLFTDDYLRWHANNGLGTVNMSKMDIAKSSVTSLIDSAPTVDFGLEVFNHNHNNGHRNGGRIIFGLQDLTPTKTSTLKGMINDLIPMTWTPLCESVYEAYRYFSGRGVHFGDDDRNHSGDGSNHYYDVDDHPGQDFSIQSAGSYITPYKTCSNQVSIILITDGAPTNDHSADNLVTSLGSTIGSPHSYDNNYLVQLAKYMHEQDINTNMPGTQTSSLYTIGFDLGGSSAVQLLKDASSAGGGRYYDASDPSSLLSKLQSALTEILKVDTSFTAPSVAASTFNRTETLDNVYYAMFEPDRGPRWQGNIKKLMSSGGDIVDRTGAVALESNGSIKSAAKTFWSTSTVPDGGEVAKGGVAEMLAAMAPSARTIYSDLGSSGTLKPFTRTNAEATTAYSTSTALAAELGVPETDIDEYLNWAKGIDVDDVDNDNNTSEMRRDVFGDPLHSKPVVLNYGGTPADIRIVIGTNAGAVHMFQDEGNTVKENWAIMPKEFIKNYKDLRDNFTSVDKVYGVDGSPVSYILDLNGDGEISGAGEVAWIFFGLRRGGSSIYAIDVTSKSTPKLMWHIDKSTAGFGSMGQSWSTPTVGFSKINASGGIPKPVLIFGAGYSTGKDVSGIGSADSDGKGVYMVDAEKGTLLWSLTDSTSPSFPGTDSVPSSIATMDSDFDGYIDRLYFGDTGGYVWRIDMPGTITSDWLATQVASLGSDTVEADDRRFFAEPSIARAFITETFEHTETVDGTSVTTIHKTETPYDAILIGSGDRTAPTGSNTNDKLFMIKDENIITQKFITAPSAITTGELYDYTDDPFNGLIVNSAAYNSLAVAVSQKSGWFIDLEGVEEKNLAKPEAIAGVAYYNSFTPTVSSENSCTVGGGVSKLYAVNLELGTKIYTERVMEIGNTIQDGISIITVPEDESDPSNPKESNRVTGSPLRLLVAGEAMPLCDADGNNCGDLQLQTTRTSLVVSENN